MTAPDLGRTIHDRRIQMGLTIEQAARKAGVTAKSWSGYESGRPMRADKARAVKRALGWTSFPETTPGSAPEDLQWITDCIDSHKAWSPQLADRCGVRAALAFCIGSDLLTDHIKEDLGELAHRPRGTHLGELPMSWTADLLPACYLTRYDYEFLYRLLIELDTLRDWFHNGHLVAHSVAQEVLLHAIDELTQDELEEWTAPADLGSYRDDEYWDEWRPDVCEDDDVSMVLYSRSPMAFSPSDCYFFDHWFDWQFWTSDGQERPATPTEAEE